MRVCQGDWENKLIVLSCKCCLALSGVIHASTKSACVSDRQVLAVFSESHCSMIHVPQSVSRRWLLYERQAWLLNVSQVWKVFLFQLIAIGHKTCLACWTDAGEEHLQGDSLWLGFVAHVNSWGQESETQPDVPGSSLPNCPQGLQLTVYFLD